MPEPKRRIYTAHLARKLEALDKRPLNTQNDLRSARKLEALDKRLLNTQNDLRSARKHIEDLEAYLKLKAAYNPNFRIYQFKNLNDLKEDGGMVKSERTG